jgi:16S rRNA processing protein RimM
VSKPPAPDVLMGIPDLGGSGKRRVPEPRFLTIARVIKPWGVRGDLKLEVLTDFPDRLNRLTRVYLGPEAVPHTVAHFRWHSGELLLRLTDVGDRNAAELLRDQLVQIARPDAVELPPGQFYEHQIIGLKVVTEDGELLGQVVEVLATGANDVYVVQGPRGEVLLPARIEVVRAIDLDAGTMTVRLLPGLVEG